MENKWVIYVKKFAQKHNMTYGEALRCANYTSFPTTTWDAYWYNGTGPVELIQVSKGGDVNASICRVSEAALDGFCVNMITNINIY